MPEDDANNAFRMGTWLVQPSLNRLSDGDQIVTVEPRVMDTLACLASRPGKIVSADELLDTIWHGRAHADDTIYQAVANLRKVLGDVAHRPRYIETIPKRGYRLICPVTPLAADSEMPEIALHSPNGRRRRHRNFAIAAGIASIAAAIILIVNSELLVRLSPTNDAPNERSVAVLPFVDMSEDGSQQYLGDGVAEELIHVLSNLKDLRVTARTSSFAFRDSNEDIRQIGSKLNVATILEGSIRKDGDRLRVTSQLVDIRDGYHLWSQTFDRHSSDIFRIQNEIAVAVATAFEYRQLDVLATDDRATQINELETYELFLLGLHQLHSETASNLLLAIEHFESVIEKDPGYARAYAGLSESFSDLYDLRGDQDLLRKAESAAEFALRLDDQSADSYRAIGFVKTNRKDYSGAEAAFTKAIELNPNDVKAYSYLAAAYRQQGRESESIELLQKALQLHPMSGRLNNRMGLHYWSKAGDDWDTTFEYFKRAMERDPNYPYSYWSVGHYYYSIGQPDRAIPYVKKVVDLTSGPTIVGVLADILTKIYVDIGDYESAAKFIRRMKELEAGHFPMTNVEIQLQIARGDFSVARDHVHSVLSRNVGDDGVTGWMAFYEMVIGDTAHAEEIYAHLASRPESTVPSNEANLYRSNELDWGMLGAVNLAYLHTSNGDTRAAQELLQKSREFIESNDSFFVARYTGSVFYVLAQIAAVEGNNETAIEYFRKAVESGWTKAWFGRVDPIMSDLRKDARYIQILEELEEKLLEMREHPKVLASN